ncbi:uncharacterized protein LOC143894438 isoform X1 [Temnothorax americanus]|uniref:uncharacterized protein LOC143894438 isoform X1 n=1 Tax=Temnothorax americanus TaxID=1964332 RepID=UPI004067F85A
MLYRENIMQHVQGPGKSPVYLIFLKSILYEVNEANILFQSTQQEITMAYESLTALVLSVAIRIIKPLFMANAIKTEAKFNCIEEALNNEMARQSLSNVDFGIEFKNAATAYNLNSEELDDVKVRCYQYLITLLTELLKRIPSNMSILKTSTKLCVKSILSTTKKVSVEDLPIALLDNQTDLSEVESQLRKLPFIDWSSHFPDQVMKSSTAFWSNVRIYKDARGYQPFKKLAKFALKILSLLFNNAVVERVFSVMNATKTKPQNKINFKMLDAILRIRTHFHAKKICCQRFVPSNLMYEKFTSKMYDIKLPITENTPGTSTANESEDSEECLNETMTLFAQDDDNIV